MNRILLEVCEYNFDTDRVKLSDRRASHIRNVLKGRPGCMLRVGLLNGPLGMGKIVEISADSVTLVCRWEDKIPPRPRVSLLLAMPRPKVMNRLWAQLSAMGIDRVVVINAAGTERCYFDSHVLDSPHIRARLIEGLEQAGDTQLPEVSIRKRFRPFVEDELDGLFPETLRLLAHPADGHHPRPGREEDDARNILLAVGPEGGWNKFEMNLLLERGFSIISLGPRILRTDTACIALLARLNP